MCPGILLSTSGTQGAGEEEKGPRIPNISTASDIKVSHWIIILQRFQPDWIGCHQADAILHTKQKTIRDISLDIGYDIGYYIASKEVPVKVPKRKSPRESPRVKVPW